MRWVVAVAVGLTVLLATMPAVCVSGEYPDSVEGNALGGSCVSAALLPLPWDDATADTLGWVVSLLLAAGVVVGVGRLPAALERLRTRRRRPTLPL